ncbi:MAG TPA: S41 family peptidase [Bryobacteraceae bacterium]|nr:S41 family peptidase [Bryobacteraceae bacterium]
MNRRFQFVLVGFSTAIVALLLFGAVGRSASPETPYAHLGVYSEVLSRIKADYVEEPDMKAVTIGAINGMLESLDPYASYLNADQYKQYLKSKEGAKKADIGLVLAKRLGYMAVEDAIPGSPAAEAGFATGDVIETINNVSTRDMPLAFAEILLQGDAGTTVELGVIRVRRSEPSKMTVKRAQVAYPPVTGRLQGRVGIIAVPGLQTGRAKDVAAQIASLEKQGANKLVLDLRHCSTGSDEEGVALANLFMDTGLITYTQGQKQARQDYRAMSRSVTQVPLALIVNRSTAGGAEIAAAALLNSKRAQLIGERTYGDAAVRKTLALNDGAAVILSVAKYYSPDGKAIQDNGVTPGILQAEADTAADLADDLPDAVQDDTSKKPATDELLNKAIQALPQ